MDCRMVSIDSVRILVLDEADRMLDMGFKPQVDKIVRRLPNQRQTMFFATLDGEVGELAQQYTDHPASFEAELPLERREGDVEHRFVPVTPESKLDTLVELLQKEAGLALVFIRTSAAPIGWRRSSSGATYAQSRCTATSPSARANGRCAGSRPAR